MSNLQMPQRILDSRILAKQLKDARLARWQVKIEAHDERKGEPEPWPKEKITATKTAVAEAEPIAIADKAKAEADAAKIDAQAKPKEKEAAEKLAAEKQANIDSIARAKAETAYQERLAQGKLIEADQVRYELDKTKAASEVEFMRALLKQESKQG